MPCPFPCTPTQLLTPRYVYYIMAYLGVCRNAAKKHLATPPPGNKGKRLRELSYFSAGSHMSACVCAHSSSRMIQLIAKSNIKHQAAPCVYRCFIVRTQLKNRGQGHQTFFLCLQRLAYTFLRAFYIVLWNTVMISNISSRRVLGLIPQHVNRTIWCRA